ncbi:MULTISPECIES: decaprenyl-phosphate phosphoribosyltransferase [unclassified Leucobacter]|uniref:decaprenyl-phosphate phosphoribosyltransferase n=1 Tax=unclassified Leucobacter TaxID=2621730 RepID=UPI003015CFA3
MPRRADTAARCAHRLHSGTRGRHGPDSAARPPRIECMRSLFPALRPKQWVKNLLVFAVPLAAGRLFEPQVLLQSLLGFVVFCAASSTVYLVNDLMDRESDRIHPSKRYRPIASGRVSPRTATSTAVVLGLGAVVTPFLTGAAGLGAVVITYLALQALYVTWAKHRKVVDMLSVATGFCLRGIAGAAATGIPVSAWFMLVIMAGSLFMVAGKRYSELLAAQHAPTAYTRSTLAQYSVTFLQFVWAMSGTMLVLGYSLWAFQIAGFNQVFTVSSVVPFLAIVLYYASDIDKGRAEGPEMVLFRNRSVQIAAVVWFGLFAAAVLVPAEGMTLFGA